jgi:hypothetical protein
MLLGRRRDKQLKVDGLCTVLGSICTWQGDTPLLHNTVLEIP